MGINQHETINNLLKLYIIKSNDNINNIDFFYNNKQLNSYIGERLTLIEVGLKNNEKIIVKSNSCLMGAGEFDGTINIKFLKLNQNQNTKQYFNSNLNGILKLCFLKELSSKLESKKLSDLSPDISNIMLYLKNGYIENNNMNNCISDILKKANGNNILSFSKYIDEIIDSNNLKNIINLLKSGRSCLCFCSSREDYYEMLDIKNRIYKYNEYANLFEKSFQQAKEEAIFEFSIISLVVIERKDLNIFERERAKCPNREDKILYHGTQIDFISSILTNQFNKSETHYQHGKGVYFTTSLDYCWFYGGTIDNRKNMDQIPGENDTFTLIASAVYYDRFHFRTVMNSSYHPKKK